MKTKLFDTIQRANEVQQDINARTASSIFSMEGDSPEFWLMERGCDSKAIAPVTAERIEEMAQLPALY
jgi:hypothetical protein